jgi:transcriptional regulator with XRE-family HTH domain
MPLRSDRVQRLQREKELTNRYIANVIGVNENTVSRWVSGKRQPGVLSLNQLAALLEVSIEYLMGITDDPTPPSDDIGELSDEERRILMIFRRGGRKGLKRLLGDDDE